MQLATKASRITDLPIMLEVRANTAVDLFARVKQLVCLKYPV